MKIPYKLKKKQKHVANLLNKIGKIQKERERLIDELQSECTHLSISQYINKRHNIKHRICGVCGYKEIISENQYFSSLNTNTITKINRDQFNILSDIY